MLCYLHFLRLPAARPTPKETPVRFVARVVLVLVVLVVSAAPAAAASFPCSSYLNTMRHAKRHGHVAPVSEDYARAQRDRWQRQADKDAKDPATQHFVGMDLAQKAIWDGELHYLLALERVILDQNCSRFHYVDVLRRIDHRYRHLYSDQQKKAGDPAQVRTVNYEAGGMTALGTNRQRIVAMARKRGVAIR